jgi:hypothetical protein
MKRDVTVSMKVHGTVMLGTVEARHVGAPGGGR